MPPSRADSLLHTHVKMGAKRNTIWLAVIFLAVFLCLHYLYNMVRDTWLEHLILDTLTVKTSAVLINILSPVTSVQADGHALIGSFGRLTVALGCEGTETILLLVAAIVAFTAPWRQKIVGGLLGTVILFALNQARIVGLFFTLQERPQWFNALHGYLAPTVIILAATIYFVGWTARVQQMRHVAASAS